MKGIKRSVAVLAAVGTAFALTPIAGAQQDVTPKFSLGDTSFLAASEFKVTIEEGTCPGGPVSITSSGFAAPVDLTTLRGKFADTTGWFTATLKCKDTATEGTAGFGLTKPPAPRTDPFLDKAEYAPGETINIRLERGYKCGFEPATSEGFAARAKLTQGPPDNYTLTGQTKAVDAPGTYEARIKCLTNSVVNRFTVKATATTPPPGTPAPKPKPPVVKPKGDPETGGGGTA